MRVAAEARGTIEEAYCRCTRRMLSACSSGRAPWMWSQYSTKIFVNS